MVRSSPERFPDGVRFPEAAREVKVETSKLDPCRRRRDVHEPETDLVLRWRKEYARAYQVLLRALLQTATGSESGCTVPR